MYTTKTFLYIFFENNKKPASTTGFLTRFSTSWGRWRRTVLTAWNTSTSPCWMTCSMHAFAAQYTPHLCTSSRLPFCGWHLAKSWMRSSQVWMRSSQVCGWDLAKRGWDLAKSWMRSSQVWMRSSQVCGWDLAKRGWDLAKRGWAKCGWDLAKRVDEI